MRCTRMPRSLFLLAYFLVVAVVPACGRRHETSASGADELTFERLADTTGLADGPAIVEDFEPYRMDSGALRFKGRARLPDGAKLRVAIRPPGERLTLKVVQVTVEQGRFDSPPIIGARGPLPVARYEFEITAQFVPEWQTPDVLRATQEGRALRGPGMTRTRVGGAMLWLTQERTL